MYLRMQRRQLDESRRLLERLEQNTSAPLHSTSLPASRLDTGESGTVGPTRRAGGGGGGGGAGVGGRGGWASQGATPPVSIHARMLGKAQSMYVVLIEK